MAVTAIVLAHGPEPTLLECVHALLLGGGVDELIVVDNEASPASVEAVRAVPGVRMLTPGRNLGFAGGCNHAAARAGGEILVFVNSDAVVRPGAVAALCRTLEDPTVGLACGNIRLAQDPSLLNTAGNPVHYLMFSWVGGLGEPAREHAQPGDISSITGVAFAVRREVWDRLGGFDDAYVAYCEDVYLSLRAWQLGYRVVHEPSAVVLHHYDFGRHGTKHYLLERNRLMNLALLPEARTQRLLALPAAAVELGVLIVALRDGWAGDKLAGWRWLLAHRRDLAARRRDLQRERVVPDRDLTHLLRGPLDPPPGLGPHVPRLVSRALDRYWGWASARL